MSSDLNKVQLIGRLGRDPECKQMQNGGTFATMSIATSERWNDKQTGNKREKTEWHRVVAFDTKLAEIIEKYVHKGDLIYVEGKLRTRKWQDKDGRDQYSTEVVLEKFDGRIQMLGGSRGNGGDRGRADDSGGRYDEETFGRPKESKKESPPEYDDEIPF